MHKFLTKSESERFQPLFKICKCSQRIALKWSQRIIYKEICDDLFDEKVCIFEVSEMISDWVTVNLASIIELVGLSFCFYRFLIIAYFLSKQFKTG